jgi:hypothetical protein
MVGLTLHSSILTVLCGARFAACILSSHDLMPLMAILLSCMAVQAMGRKPVWRQLLQHLLAHSHPEVAQQAAAALAE